MLGARIAVEDAVLEDADATMHREIDVSVRGIDLGCEALEGRDETNTRGSRESIDIESVALAEHALDVAVDAAEGGVE